MAVLTLGPYTFLSAQATEGGFLYATSERAEEKLTTPGVDGARWRTVSEQMLPATLDCVAESLSFQDAVARGDAYRNLKGTLVAVSWTAGGFTYRYKDVHVADVQAKPVMGVVVGGGASTSAVAHVRVSFVLENTDFTKFTT